MVETIQVTDDLLRKQAQLVIDFCVDNGANVLDAIARDEEKQHENWIGTQFFGYESTGRKPITLKDLQEFITRMARLPSLKSHSTLIIKALGTMDFEKEMPIVEYVDIPDKSPHPIKVKQPAPPRPPTRRELKKAKFFGRKRRDKLAILAS